MSQALIQHLIRERIYSGLEAAKEKGVKLGRPSHLTNMEQVIQQYCQTDLTIAEIARQNNVSRPTIYRWLDSKNVPRRPK